MTRLANKLTEEEIDELIREADPANKGHIEYMKFVDDVLHIE